MVNADHELKKQPKQAEPKDSHLSWHQFDHELSFYGDVRASMSPAGILTLSGHIDDGIDKHAIEMLARKVIGVIEIRNLLVAD